MPIWPPEIKLCPIAGSYQEHPADAVIRTGFSTGPGKTRRRFTATPLNIRLTLPGMNSAQYSTFKSWYFDDLLDGSLPFDAEHPITGQPGRFRFRSVYRSSVGPRKVSVQIDLEMLP